MDEETMRVYAVHGDPQSQLVELEWRETVYFMRAFPGQYQREDRVPADVVLAGFPDVVDVDCPRWSDQ